MGALWCSTLPSFGASGQNNPECEAIEVSRRGMSGFDDRANVLIAYDHQALTYDQTRALVMRGADPEAVVRITICDGVPASTTASLIWLFGKQGGRLDTLREGVVAYVLLPLGPPPKGAPPRRTAVVLGVGERFKESNLAWREWCKKRNVPIVQIDEDSPDAVAGGVHDADKLLVTRAQKPR